MGGLLSKKKQHPSNPPAASTSGDPKKPSSEVGGVDAAAPKAEGEPRMDPIGAGVPIEAAKAVVEEATVVPESPKQSKAEANFERPITAESSGCACLKGEPCDRQHETTSTAKIKLPPLKEGHTGAEHRQEDDPQTPKYKQTTADV